MSTITETLFAPLAITTAPEASRPMLEEVKKSIGFIPNLLAIFANNTTVLEGYLAWAPCSRGLLHTNRTANHPAGNRITAQPHIHRSRRASSIRLLKSLQSVHSNTPIPDARLNALVTLLRELVRERGYAKEKTI